MKKPDMLAVLGCLAALSCMVAVAEPPSGVPAIRCEAPVFAFGTNAATETVAHEFAITNAGDGPLIIEKINTGCGCTTSSLSATNLPPGGVSRLGLQFRLAGRSGVQRRTIYVHSNDPACRILQLQLVGEVAPAGPAPLVPPVGESIAGPAGRAGGTVSAAGAGEPATAVSTAESVDLHAFPREIVLAPLESGTNAVTRHVAIRSRSGRAFRILGATVDIPGATATWLSLGTNACRVTVSGILSAPASENGQVLVISTDRDGEREIAVPIRVLTR